MEYYNFKPEYTLDSVIKWIKQLARQAMFNKVVIGISGGKDSAIAAALCCRALGSENVSGLLLPNGVQSDINDSVRVCKQLNIHYEDLNIKPVYDAVLAQYKTMESFSLTKEACINISPRIRMIMLRLWAQSNKCRVCGTSNLSEIVSGYFTKDGDSSYDFNPLGGLTSVEVVEIGKLLEELPQDIVVKVPADGLSGLSDEERLGVTYNEIHRYIRDLKLPCPVWLKIHEMDWRSAHKRNVTSPYFKPHDFLLYDTKEEGE